MGGGGCLGKWGVHGTLCVSLQIAAKIGGDAGPPMNNNGGGESYPFAAQKRSLEDAGTDSDGPDHFYQHSHLSTGKVICGVRARAHTHPPTRRQTEIHALTPT